MSTVIDQTPRTPDKVAGLLAQRVYFLRSRSDAKRRARTRPGAGFWIAVLWVALLGGAAIFANFLPFSGPDNADFTNLNAPALSFHGFLGTDNLGRSELSRVVYGARVSLGVGFAAAAFGAVVGGILGLIAGYVRRWGDTLISILTDAMLAFPPLIFLLAIVEVLPKTAITLGFALGVVTVPAFVRLSRANTLTYAQREFVLAAQCLGFKRRRILFREILPNVLPPILAYYFIIVALVIVAEGSLDFLGIGIQPPTPTWGRMISDGVPLLATVPHLVIVPSVVMFVTLLAFNRIGERLGTILVPASRG